MMLEGKSKYENNAEKTILQKIQSVFASIYNWVLCLFSKKEKEGKKNLSHRHLRHVSASQLFSICDNLYRHFLGPTNRSKSANFWETV